MYECPLCGASTNRKDRPFETPGAVIGHIEAKRDEQHAGESGEDWRGEIEADRSESAAEEPASGGEDLDQEREPDRDRPSENPTFGSAGGDVTVPDTHDRPSGGGGAVTSVSLVELPCGHEEFPESDIPRYPSQVTCEVCGETYTVVEDGKVALPCLHEQFDKERAERANTVDGKLPVTCETCGETFWYE